MTIAAFLLALALTPAPAEPATPDSHIPQTGWRDDEWASRFYERWYGGQLRAMGEAPLILEDGYRSRFRLLVLPHDDPGYAVRIDVLADGSGIVRWVELDGAGAYAPGKVARQGSRPLEPAELRRFEAALDAAGLDALPRQNDESGLTINRDGTQTLEMCFHATHIVFDHVDGNGRRFVARPNCWEEKPLRRLRRAASRMARIKA